MVTKTIGVRELHQDLTTIAKAVARGKSFVVVRHTKPLFQINPIKDEKNYKYTIDDLKKIRFSGGKSLSKDIDKIVYGV